MRKSTKEDYESRILRVQIYIQQHLDARPSLEELARVARFSSYHFHRIFKAMVGESIQEYIRRLRLERAAMALQHTRRSVIEIAFEAGYETHESFTRAFRSRFDAAPSGFRKRYRASAAEKTAERYVAVLRKIDKEENPVNVTVKEIEPLTVAFVRHTGPYAKCHEAWKTLCSSPDVCKLFGPSTQFMGICYDDPDVTDADKIRYDACATVPNGTIFSGDINVQQIEGGKFATYVHKGSFDGLHDCYRRIYGEWLPQSGFEPKAAPSLEVYLTDPEKTPPEENLTEIRIPLA